MLTAKHAVDLQLVLLLTDPRVAADLGEPAWLAAAEAAQLYAPDEEWLTIPVDDAREVSVKPMLRRRYIGPRPIAGTESELPYEDALNLLGEIGALSAGAKISGTSWVDQRALVALVGEALGTGDASVVVVTDRPIQPPADFRYLIWDAVPGGVAVSMATLDPRHWSEPAELPERQRAVKRRLRAALCSVLGTLIGLVRCDNPWCFLYADVDTVTRLDNFLFIGEEHGVGSLTGRGFAPETSGVEFEDVVDVGPAPA